MTAMIVMLAAHDAGLAAGFAGPQDIPALRQVLGLPGDFHPIGVIPVGRPLADKRSPSLGRGWVPFEDYAHWDRWSFAGDRSGPRCRASRGSARGATRRRPASPRGSGPLPRR